MAQNTLTQNVETATTVIKEVKEAIQEKGIEIPEGTHATTYPGYIAKMTSQAELEEFKEQVVLNGTNQSEIKVSAPIIELTATEGNINLDPTTGEAHYKGVEIATVSDILNLNDRIDNIQTAQNDYLPLSGGTVTGSLYAKSGLGIGNATGSEEGAPGVYITVRGSVELKGAASGGAIDFHHYTEDESLDYTSRIIENATGIVNIGPHLRVGPISNNTQTEELYVDGKTSLNGTSTYKGNEIATTEDISKVSIEVTAINNQVTTLQDNIDDLDDRLSTTEQNITTNTNNISTNSNRIDTIETNQNNYVTLNTNQTIDGAKNFTSDLIKAENLIINTEKNFTNDGVTGVGLFSSGGISLTGGEHFPRIIFYQDGVTSSSSSIQESYPGILSIPKKLSVGTLRDTSIPLDSLKLYVDGDTQVDGIARLGHTLSGITGVIVPNNVYYSARNTNGEYVALMTVTSLNNSIFGIGSYEHREGTSYFEGNDIIIRSRQGIKVTTSADSMATYNGNEIATVNEIVKNVNGVAGIATFTTDSEAEAYSTANPTVLVISTQQ